jgi:hypothetical protein
MAAAKKKSSPKASKPRPKKTSAPSRREPQPSVKAKAEATSDVSTSTEKTNTIIYISGLEKYVLERDGRYDLERPVGRDAAFKFLVRTKDVDPKEAKLILSEVLHPVVDTVDCDPEKDTVFINEQHRQVVNSYVPPRLKPKEGKYPTILKLLSVLVNHDDAGLKWLLNWFAAKYQQPGTRSITSVTIIGPQGVGKSAMGCLFALMLGEENTSAVSGRDFKEKFNSSFVNKLWVVVDELVVASGRNEVVETLKTYHSDASITMRTPHARRVSVPNRMTLWMTSNDQAAVKLEANGDRRYTIFTVPPNAATSEHKAMLNGMFEEQTKKPSLETMAELAAFAHALKSYKVAWGAAKVPFENEARKDLAQASRSATESFLDAVAESKGAVSEWTKRFVASLPEAKRAEVGEFEFPEGFTVDITYKAFAFYAHEQGFGGSKMPTKDQFGVAWKARFGEQWKRYRRPKMPREYVFAGTQCPAAINENAARPKTT